MSRRRIEEAVPLVIVAGLATIAVLTLPAETPLRIVAGIALILVLPWLAASRLAPLRESDLEGGRISGAGALTLALVVLLGLLLSTGGDGIATRGVAVGMLIVTTALAVLGSPGGNPLPRPNIAWRHVFGLVLTVTAVAVAIFAFTIARNRALTQARQGTAYAAFLANDGDRFDVGLTNSTGRAALFTVREVGEDKGREVAVTVPARSTRKIEDFLDRPPSLRPLERLAPRRVEPVKIRVTVTTDGRHVGRALNLSTYAP